MTVKSVGDHFLHDCFTFRREGEISIFENNPTRVASRHGNALLDLLGRLFPIIQTSRTLDRTIIMRALHLCDEHMHAVRIPP